MYHLRFLEFSACLGNFGRMALGCSELWEIVVWGFWIKILWGFSVSISFEKRKHEGWDQSISPSTLNP